MKTIVKFFGATADVVGRREIVFETNAASSGTAYAEILDKFPELSRFSLLFAVNEKFADGSERLCENDELAIFTAVSGG